MQNLQPYLALLATWMPGAGTRALRDAPARMRFDGVLTWKGPKGTIRYLLEEKRHLQNQDVRVVIDQMERWRDRLRAAERGAKFLLLAPTVRPHQAAILQHAGIDYLDLAGNAHLAAPGVLDRLDSPDAVIVGLVAREDGRVPVEDGDRVEIFDLFQWFRRAAGV